MSSFPVLMPGLEPSELGLANSGLGWCRSREQRCLAHSLSLSYGLLVFAILSLSGPNDSCAHSANRHSTLRGTTMNMVGSSPAYKQNPNRPCKMGVHQGFSTIAQCF